MDYFRGNLYDYFKERRLGALFFTAFGVVLGATALGTIGYEVAKDEGWLNYWPEILPAAALFSLFLFWRSLRKSRLYRRSNRYESTPLAQDEWVKARRKLSAKSAFAKR